MEIAEAVRTFGRIVAALSGCDVRHIWSRYSEFESDVEFLVATIALLEDSVKPILEERERRKN